MSIDQTGWSDSQRRAFTAALESAREDLYQKIRKIRVSEREGIDDVVRHGVVSVAELRDLAASARFRRVTWTADGRCRAEIRLSLLSVAEAMDRWDKKNRWAPHGQILQLNSQAILSAIGESPAWGSGGKPMSTLSPEQINPPTARLPTCHCSSLVELPSGDLLASWYGGSGEARPDSVVVVSRKPKGGAAWTPAQIVAETPGKPEGNAFLFVMPDRVLWLVYGTMHGKLDGPPGPGVRWVTCDLRCKTSTDEGRTWSDSRLLRKELGMVVRTKPIVLDNGDVIFGVENDDDSSWFWITSDCGRTWRVTGPVAGVANEQPTIIQRRDGSLLTYLRPDDHRWIARAESFDRGRTWTQAVDTDLPNPHAAIDMVKLRDGRVVLAFNNSPTQRTPLTLALSEDEGQTWPWMRDLIHEPGCEFSYPAIIQDSAGKLHVTYTHKRRWIGHFCVSPEWIMGGSA